MAGTHPGAAPAAHPGTDGCPAARLGQAGTHPGGHPAGHAEGHSSGAVSVGRPSYRPGAGPAARAYEERTGIKAPKIVAWEITRSCNLACAHCRAAAHCAPYPGELSLDECKAVMDDIASITDPILILTGGEPLMRPDIWEIIDYAFEKGLHPVIGTNGTLIDRETARKIAAHGIPKVSVSLDFPTPQGQDAFRGADGAFAQTMQGIANLRAQGVNVQVNSTITKANRDLVEDLHALAEDAGASDFHPFLLVPTGRGEDLVDVELSPQEYEEVLTWAYQRQKTSPMGFKPTDAPQYFRILHQRAAAEGVKLTGPLAHSRGCLGGISFAFISHVGDVQPCGYFDMQLGNVRTQPFSQIWTESPVFDDLRHYDRLKGKCGACEYKGVCGGCRARALAATGDYLAEEPYCAYMPKRYMQQRVLNAVQASFPLAADPYAQLAADLGFSAEQVREALADNWRAGMLRRIGGFFASDKLGYRSTLCALAVPGDDDAVDAAAAIVSAYPNVTHNYLRRARYNVWFTVIARNAAEVASVVRQICARTGCPDALNLPATRLFKVRVELDSFESSQAAQASPAQAPPVQAMPAAPAADGEIAGAPFDAADPFDVALVRWAQGNTVLGAESMRAEMDGAFADSTARRNADIRLDARPFSTAAELIGAAIGRPVTEEQVIARLKQWEADGTLRRFGATVRHRKMGYSHNGMTVWNIPDKDAEAVGRAFAELRFVSHCYERPRHADWPYNLYAMCHARGEQDLARQVEALRQAAAAVGAAPAEPLVLTSEKEYKKSSMRYFEECESLQEERRS